MVSTLEKYYVSKGFGIPKYSYLNMVDENGFKRFCAEMVLPNGITIRGDPRNSYIEVCICFLCIF